ncbi:MAG: NAD+ synthase [Chitinispirillales bacterium]|jgi:NAD+ synthase (glutamine-hydrolysing)|nr:NAD+ synthase [Chitinispirillales bacterium]
MKIALCQLNPLVGDLFGNADTVIRVLHETSPKKPDLLVFPELFLSGYPPRDLLEEKWFIDKNLAAVDKIKEVTRSFSDTGIIVGSVMLSNTVNGKGLFNSALLIYAGEILFQQNKSLLPFYDVFDENRYFDPSPSVSIVKFKGETLGISICEDAWNDEELFIYRRYTSDPIGEMVAAGATLLINISASPFFLRKQNLRKGVMRNHAVKHGLPFVFVNQIGGNDELVFDGFSKVFDSYGNVCCQLPAFREEVVVFNTSEVVSPIKTAKSDEMESLHDALTLGLFDYVKKCGLSKVVIGLSGGIDCAVVCALAVGAFGKENVWGIAMPSRYSSEESVIDARELASNLEIKFSIINIEESFSAFLNTLQPLFKDTQCGIAEENLQARIRGTLLMALSNKFGHMVLVTSNKSETAMGYSTLYGDMNGGLGVISDLYKGMVYKLAAYINRNREIIPRRTIDKAPSAELRPNQKDEDSLPPYPVLDSVLEMIIEKGKSAAEIAAAGYDADMVKWIAKMVAANEYKRRQSAPGLKVTGKAFGSGRRFPLAAKYNW